MILEVNPIRFFTIYLFEKCIKFEYLYTSSEIIKIENKWFSKDIAQKVMTSVIFERGSGAQIVNSSGDLW